MISRLLAILAAGFLLSATALAGDFVPDRSAIGSFTSPGALPIDSSGASAVAVQLSGSGAGLTGTPQATIDGTTWFTVAAMVPSSGALVTTFSANGQWVIASAGFAQVRVNLSAISSGTETITLRAAEGKGGETAASGSVTVAGTVSASNLPTTADTNTGAAGASTVWQNK